MRKRSTPTTGYDNTASGAQALYQNTWGYYNTATGYETLYANTTGCFNTASGYSALNANTVGEGNTATGYETLSNNTNGSFNTASGYGALGGNTIGNYNTAYGELALLNNTSGIFNIAIGSQAGYNITTNSDNIDIGNKGAASDNGVVRIGTPVAQTAAFVAGIYGITTGVNNAVPVMIDGNGQLGTISSSRRYKEDIQDMGEASSELMRLHPVTFRYRKPFSDGSKPIQYGLIAEEVAEVYPDLVVRSADGQIETVKYQLLDPMLLNELQKQNATIAAQKEQIRSLEERLAKVEAAVEHTSATR